MEAGSGRDVDRGSRRADGDQQDAVDLNSPNLRNLRLRIVPAPISVMIADGDRLFLEGIAALIDQWDEFRLVARATSNTEALELAIQHSPAAILMGVRMQGVDATETIRAITTRVSGAHVVVIASSGEAADVLEALRAGAQGYGVREELSADRLRGVLWGALAGEVVLAGSIGTRIREVLLSPAEPADETPHSDDLGLLETLTRREREVLALLVDGLSNAEIGQQIHLSEPTVKKNISRIIDKLQVTNRVQAAVLAARSGIS